MNPIAVYLNELTGRPKTDDEKVYRANAERLLAQGKLGHSLKAAFQSVCDFFGNGFELEDPELAYE